MSFWISTDLDGTLLDHHDYSFKAAEEALLECKKLGIPIILNTSKTLAETRKIQSAVRITGPLIIENGSALVYSERQSFDKKTRLEKTKIFGARRSHLLKFISTVRTKFDWKFEGFNDWSVSKIVNHTGLSLSDAQLASDKHYSEPFIWLDSFENFEQFKQLAQEEDFQILKGGRFYHLQGKCSKASALNWIKGNFSSVAGFEQLDGSEATLIALGDNDNDIAMLSAADIAVCIRSAAGNYPTLANHPHLLQTQEVGPRGWSEAILKIVNSKENNHG